MGAVVAISSHTERFVRSRMVRLALASTLLLLSAWAFLPYLTSRIASSAFVNAELVRVTAPIAGRLAQDLPHKGEFIAHTETINFVQALSPDQRQLLDLRRQHAVATGRAELAGRQLEEIKAADLVLAGRAEAYHDGVIKRIGREIEEAKAEKSGCLLEALQRRDVGSRMEQLAKLGTSSQIRTAEALASQEATLTRCEMAEARVQRLTVELDSARLGTYLRDGASDVPYSQQQRDRLLLRRQELETDLFQEKSKIAQLATAIGEEGARLDRVGHHDLALPADHVVWSMGASPGSTVVEGQFVLDFADCRHRFVAVELPEGEFERIKTRDRAAVRLIGSDAWSEGQVRQVRGSAARADDRLLAAQVPKPGSGSITVEIGLPDEEQSADHNNFCSIGRLAEVRFARPIPELPAIISRTLHWMAALLHPTEAPATVGSR
jgi:multidrug resistance efflux pump